MPKFQKKPVVIDAVQYTGRNVEEILAFVNTPEIEEALEGGITIHTLEGDMRADPGDWVIKGIKGEFYPCKPDIFEGSYIPVK